MASEPIRPNDLPWDPIDRALGIASAGGVAVMVFGTVWAWPHLPAMTPIHFGWSGRPDGRGDRAWVLALPVIGLSIYGLFTYLLRVPHLYDLGPRSGDRGNRRHRLARRVLGELRAIVVLAMVGCLLHVTVASVGATASLNPLLGPGLFGAVIAALGGVAGQIFRSRSA